MGLIDLSTRLGPSGVLTDHTYASWPKCWPCSLRLQRERAVDVFGDLEVEKPSELRSKYKLSFFGQCHQHGEGRVAIEIPRVYGAGSITQAVGRVFMFGASGRPQYLTRDKWMKLAAPRPK